MHASGEFNFLISVLKKNVVSIPRTNVERCFNSCEIYYTSDGGDKDQNGLRGLREKSQEVSGRNERCDASGSGPQAEQVDGDRLRGPG